MVDAIVGNNGTQLAQVMEDLELLSDDMSMDEISSLTRQLLMNPKWALNDDFWEDFLAETANMGYDFGV